MRQNNQKHNGPSVDCYGLAGSSKLNYEFGGYCYESAYPGSEWYSNRIPESRWHAIQHTLGLDFSKTDLGSILVKNDNSGNCYLGAFDPYCSGTDEKWKVHADNEFGTPQHQDLTQDKYYNPLTAHGSTVNSQFVKFDDTEVQSIDNPMTWNLWNIVRHYCYIKYFKNKNKQVNNESAWNELEAKTRKYVRAIYRTFKEKQGQNNIITTFGDKLGGESISNYGEGCSVRWTNSFVQIASVLERNARDHMASLVMFTGSGEEQYDAIRNSTYNFRVTTLNGMDDDDDGMRPRKQGSSGWVSSRPADSSKSELHTFQGFTYGQLPSSYVIGDDTVYDQMLPGVSVNLTTPLDMDKAYPESEFRLDDPTKKWIRTMTKTIMEQQVLPIYTTMENMTQDYHDLTDEDMKGITFKLIPQLYWKYEWSFNEYMIHPVGKLNPTSNNPEMYDMLGNVWELVRDDWSSTVSGLNGKTNPIVDNNNNDNAVIKGGAFDQFCRKTISATRESIGRNEYKSEHGTQANVGFRPSLEYTFENGVSGGSGGKVDLFFLFDASASQNNQISDMVKSAEDIVKKFVLEDKMDCYVGSALFLGHSVKMMCSNFNNRISQGFYQSDTVNWGTDYKSESGKNYWSYTGFPGLDDIHREETDPYVKDKKNFFNTLRSCNLDMINQFYKERDTYQESIRNGTETRRPMMSSRDGGPTGGGGGGGGGGSSGGGHSPKYLYTTHTFKYFTKYLNTYSGVRVTEDPENSREIKFAGNNHLFTYDITKNGIDYFDFPFLCDNAYHKFGCLSGYYSGCEPSCEMVSKLINDGLFFNHPWNDGIGYMFRGDDVPRLIFVFANEYDNSMYRYSASSIKQCLYAPSVHNKSILLKKLSWGNTFTPLDPFCLQMLHDDRESVKEFLDNCGVDSSSQDILIKSFDQLKNDGADAYGISNIQDYIYKLSDASTEHLSGSGLTSVAYDGAPVELCGNGAGDLLVPLTNKTPSEILSKTVYDALNSTNIRRKNGTIKNFPSNIIINGYSGNLCGMKFEESKMVGCHSNGLHTPGYFRLVDAIKHATGSNNVYFMLNDANAPRPITDGLDPDKDILTNTIFLENDSDFFYSLKNNLEDTINPKDEFEYEKKQSMQLPNGLIEKLQAAGDNKTKTWGDLVTSNSIYWSNLKDVDKFGGNSKGANKIEVIFGLNNPYTTTNIAIGHRKNCSGINNFIRDNPNAYFVLIPASDLETLKLKKQNVTDYINRLFNSEQWYTNNMIPVNEWKSGRKYQLNTFNYIGVTADVSGEGESRTIANINFKSNWDFTVDNISSIESFNNREAAWSLGYRRNDSEQRWHYTGNEYYLLSGHKSNITDCVTVTYNEQEDGSFSGSFKLVCFDNNVSYTAMQYATLSSSSLEKVIVTLEKTNNNKELPNEWKGAIREVAHTPDNVSKSERTTAETVWTNPEVLKYVYKFYNTIKTAMPLLMAYRYYTQVCQGMINSQEQDVTNYDSENFNVIKPLPIMDASKIADLFISSFGSGNLNASKGAIGSNCVIDLNPDRDSDEYTNLPGNKFPMKFCSVKDINTNDEYKTSKIVFNRIDDISGDKSVSFTMGSKSTDYNQVNDSELEKYKDDDSIMQGAENDNATITLTNGGAYQRNGERGNKKTDITGPGFYGLRWGNDSTNNSLPAAITKTNADLKTNINPDTYESLIRDERYFKNKYLFIDPFELTIAQWCYAHGNSNERSAKEFLVTANQYNDMRLSYWKYLMVYEKDKWNQLKEQLKTIPGGRITSTMSDDEVFEALTENPDTYDNTYNPLTDTRPYYYATYNDVRGSNRLLDPDTYGYTFDNKDEYQLATSGNTSSFMGILNSKVVVQTIPRIYDDSIDNTGVRWFNQFKVDYYREQWKPNGTKPHYWDMSDETNYENLKDVWCGGEIAGLNFDLPTEAQWEYCCRMMGQSKVAYPEKNLGDNFEQQEPDLDAIAWYKYKVLGSKPEPERFCAWRAAKFIFGITKDREQVNNVYEENYDSPYGNQQT